MNFPSVILENRDIAFQASIKLLLQLYLVPNPGPIIKFLHREPEAMLVLFDSHYRINRYFNYGLPIVLELLYDKSGPELIVTISIPNDIPILSGLEKLGIFTENLPHSPLSNIAYTVDYLSLANDSN